MATITPTLTLTSNAASATTLPGPLSIALSLSATDALTVDTVQSKIVTVSATHAVLWDASAISDGTQTAGTDGGFVYVKNLTGTSNIYIGYGTAANMAADDTAIRLMTLKPGEFAWFPWDLNADIAVDAAGAGTLETWYFDRG